MATVMYSIVKVNYKVTGSNNKDWYQIMAQFTDHLIVPDLSSVLNSCYYRRLWLKFHCIVVINKQIMAQIHTSLSYIYYHLVTFYLAWNLKKRPNNNKYNLGLCIFAPKFAYLSQQYNETSIIIVCNSKNLIG